MAFVPVAAGLTRLGRDSKVSTLAPRVAYSAASSPSSPSCLSAGVSRCRAYGPMLVDKASSHQKKCFLPDFLQENAKFFRVLVCGAGQAGGVAKPLGRHPESATGSPDIESGILRKRLISRRRLNSGVAASGERVHGGSWALSKTPRDDL